MSLGPQHAAPEMPRRGLAVTSMFLAGALFAVMTMTAKMLGNPAWCRPLPTGEITLARFAFGVIVMLPLVFYKPARLLGTDRRGLLWRGLTGGVAVYTYFLAIRYTTLTNAVLLNLTSVAFAPLFARLYLGERMSRQSLIALLVAAVGIALVIRPRPDALRIGDLYGLISGMLAGMALTAVRRLRQEETAAAVFFYFSLVGVPVSLLGMAGSSLVLPDAAGWRLLLFMAAASVGAQVLMTYGYRYVTTAQGVLITLSQIVYSAIAGAILFSEPITMATVAGAVLILAAGITVSRAQPPRQAVCTRA